MRARSEDVELRFTVDRELMEKLQEILGISRGTEIASSALALLDWAASEVSAGRFILSSDATGKDVHRLAMPALSRVSARAKGK